MREIVNKGNELQKAYDAIERWDTNPDYLQVYKCPVKGKGIITKKAFREGEFVVFYAGEVAQKARKNDVYCFELQQGTRRKKTVIIDATLPDHSYGRLINDNHYNPNLCVRKVCNSKGVPFPAFFARRPINENEIIEYDYGGDKRSYWWRNLSDCVAPQKTEDCIAPTETEDCVVTPINAECVSRNETEDCISPKETDDCVVTPTNASCVSQNGTENCIAIKETDDCVVTPTNASCVSQNETENCIAIKETEDCAETPINAGCASQNETEDFIFLKETEDCVVTPINAGCVSQKETNYCIAPQKAMECLLQQQVQVVEYKLRKIEKKVEENSTLIKNHIEKSDKKFETLLKEAANDRKLMKDTMFELLKRQDKKLENGMSVEYLNYTRLIPNNHDLDQKALLSEWVWKPTCPSCHSQISFEKGEHVVLKGEEEDIFICNGCYKNILKQDSSEGGEGPDETIGPLTVSSGEVETDSENCSEKDWTRKVENYSERDPPDIHTELSGPFASDVLKPENGCYDERDSSRITVSDAGQGVLEPYSNNPKERGPPTILTDELSGPFASDVLEAGSGCYDEGDSSRITVSDACQGILEPYSNHLKERGPPTILTDELSGPFASDVLEAGSGCYDGDSSRITVSDACQGILEPYSNHPKERGPPTILTDELSGPFASDVLEAGSGCYDEGDSSRITVSDACQGILEPYSNHPKERDPVVVDREHTLDSEASAGPKMEADDRLNSNSEKESSVLKESVYKRPARPCLYCLRGKKYPYEFKRLTKHLRTKHKKEKEVIEALSHPDSKEQNLALELLRKEAMKELNIENFHKFGNNAVIRRERRQGENKLKMCQKCLGFFSKSSFSVHAKRCEVKYSDKGLQLDNAEPIRVDYVFQSKDNNNFDTNVIGSLSDDEVGQIIRQTFLLISIGKALYNSRYSESNKEKGNAANARQNLRILANLFLKFREKMSQYLDIDPTNISFEEMFQRQTRVYNDTPSFNLRVLEEVVEDITSPGSNPRGKIYWTLIKAVNIMKGIYSTNCKDDLATELTFFKDALKSDGQTSGIFSDAIHAPHYVRENKLRKPGKLPTSEDVGMVRDYVIKEIETINNPYSISPSNIDFRHLRRVLVTRLTFLNGRRGGEASRLTINQYKDAKQNEWIDHEMRNLVRKPEELALLCKFRLAYIHGKGKSVVPLLIPEDCLRGMDMLCDMEFRHRSSVRLANKYVFPATKWRDYNVTGTSDISCILKLVEPSSRITATTMRHYISTKYAYNNASKEDLYYFSMHFGHDSQINQKIYQCPMSVQEIIRVGGVLDAIDKRLRKGNLEKKGNPGNATRTVVGSEIHHENDNENFFIPPSTSHEFSDEQSRPVSSKEEDDNGSFSFETAKTPEKSDPMIPWNPPDAKSDFGAGGFIQDPVTQVPMECPGNSNSREVSKTEKSSRKRKLVPRATWTEEEQLQLRSYFNNYIEDFSCIDSCKGKNPPSELIQEFISKHPRILAEFTPKSRKFKIRTKCFNLRKSLRVSRRKSMGLFQKNFS